MKHDSKTLRLQVMTHTLKSLTSEYVCRSLPAVSGVFESCTISVVKYEYLCEFHTNWTAVFYAPGATLVCYQRARQCISSLSSWIPQRFRVQDRSHTAYLFELLFSDDVPATSAYFCRPRSSSVHGGLSHHRAMECLRCQGHEHGRSFCKSRLSTDLH